MARNELKIINNCYCILLLLLLLLSIDLLKLINKCYFKINHISKLIFD